MIARRPNISMSNMGGTDTRALPRLAEGDTVVALLLGSSSIEPHA